MGAGCYKCHIFLLICFLFSLFLNMFLLLKVFHIDEIPLKLLFSNTKALRTNCVNPEKLVQKISEIIFLTNRIRACDRQNKTFSKWNIPYDGFKLKLRTASYPGCDVKHTLSWLADLKTKEKKIYSQNGEDGITEAIFEKIGHGKKFFVEFGVESGVQCNSRILREKHGWNGIMFDGSHLNSNISLFRAEIWVDTVLATFRSKNIPKHIDFLSVDTDFADFWLIKTILEGGYKPRVIAIEFNRNLGPYASLTVPLKLAENHTFWNGTNYFGASALTFAKLLRPFGYNLAYIDKQAVNLFFIHESEFSGIDFALAKWVEFVSNSTKTGVALHEPDRQNRAYHHVCMTEQCTDSFQW